MFHPLEADVDREVSTASLTVEYLNVAAFVVAYPVFHDLGVQYGTVANTTDRIESYHRRMRTRPSST